MACFLGIDTSNYTTSAALYDPHTGEITQRKQLLEVKAGALGLRQSDAVFAHVKQLGVMLDSLLIPQSLPLAGIGVSVRPRDVEGSYMPCFLVGELAAQAAGAAAGVAVWRVSHQAGHIAAALYSANCMQLIDQPFLAFHLSGGTTECVLVRPDKERVFAVELFAQSLDLKAGQAVDRVGGMLGLPFPAGPHLEALALQSTHKYTVKPSSKQADCSLSGIENQCRRMVDAGEAPCDIALYCLESIAAAVIHMTAAAKAKLGDLPVVYAGGVMSNTIIRDRIARRFGGYFAQPQFSSDNAAGVAVLAHIIQGRYVK